MTIEIKRVVSAVDAEGRSIVQEAAPLPPITADIMPGTEIYNVWGTEGDVVAPVQHPAQQQTPTFFPGPGGTRFGVFTFPPEQRDAPPAEAPAPEVLDGLVADIEGKLPGLIGVFEPDAPGFHQTRTVDYDIVLEGTLTVEFDDGAEVELPRGTVIVQNGTRHAWHNYGDVTAVLAFVAISAE